MISQSNKLYNFSVMQAMPNSQANRLGNFQANRLINFQANRLIFRQTDFSGKHTGCKNSQADRISSFLRPAGCVTVQASRSHSCEGQPAVLNFRPASCKNFQAGRLCEFSGKLEPEPLSDLAEPVSYTHLTLPTSCCV